MEAKKEMAVERFMKGYNCCQAVACAYCEELGMREEDVFKMTEGFGSGMGGLKDTCGAVTGMFLTISLANSAGDMENPKLTKADTYRKFREAAAKFRDEMGSIYCRDLLTEKGQQPLLCCIRCVECAAGIVDKFMSDHTKGL